jgi:hypothetical protein
MKGAGGASCQGGQLCAAWNKCFTAAAPGDLIKKMNWVGVHLDFLHLSL